MPDSIKLIISGGQSGADLAGNIFADSKKIPTRIYAFEDFKPIEQKDVPLLSEFPFFKIACKRNDYIAKLNERTEHNVKRADATIIFIDRPLSESRGSELTKRLCEKNKKPCIVCHVDFPDESSKQISSFLYKNTPVILNIAGGRHVNKVSVIRILQKVWDTRNKLSVTKERKR